MTTKWADVLAKAVAETGLQPSDPSPVPIITTEPAWPCDATDTRSGTFEAGRPTPENLAWFKEQGYIEVTHRATKRVLLSRAAPFLPPAPRKGYTLYWWLRRADGDSYSYVRMTRRIEDYAIPSNTTLTVWWKKTPR